MRDNLLFGSAYYLEYMPYDRLEEDIKMMKEAGMNVIRIAESTWSTLEPRDDEYDFSYIDRVLEIAKREDMDVIIGTPTYAIPAWLAKKDEDVLVHDENGHAKYGHRQNMDIMNPTFRFHAERIIRKLISHTATHPSVIGFQIDNETKHYGTAGDNVQALFRAYLQNKFKTTDRLNQTFFLAYWSNSIHDWDDLPDMRGCVNGGLASEFARFQRWLVNEYLQWQSDIVAEYKRPDQFITQNFDFEWKKFGADIAQDGYSYGVQPDVNHYEAAKTVTIAGTDIYHPTQDELTGAEIAFGGDEIRSLKQDNYLVLESQAQAFKYWTPYPGQLRLQAYSHLASGADSVMYWNWHSIHNGYETYWKGILSHDLAWNETYGEACTIGKEWKQIGNQLLHLKKNNQVALVIDNQSLQAFKWFPIDKDLSYNDVVRRMYDCLYEMNIECDVVDVHALDTSRYKMIITPALYAADEETIGKLREFTNQGGVLISTFRSFISDEYLSVYHDKMPHGMTECFGMSYNQFTEPRKMLVADAHTDYFAELLSRESAESLGDYQHKYWGKYAGITKNHYGSGIAYYIGCYTTKEKIKEIYEEARREAGLEVPDFQWPVIVRSGINSSGDVLHYILHYTQEQENIICPYDNVTDILTGNQYQKGSSIHLNDWGVVILKEISPE